MRIIIVIIVLFLSEQAIAQFPLYYQFNKIEGTLYRENGDSISVRMRTRNKIEIEGGSEDERQFLRTLMIHRHGRKRLEHLITTSSKITLIISEKVGIRLEDGKYRLIAGITGPQNGQSIDRIDETRGGKKRVRYRKPHEVYAENTLEIFKGSVDFAWNGELVLDGTNVKLFVYG